MLVYVYEDNLFRFIDPRQNIGSNNFVQGLPVISYTAYKCHPTVCLHRSYQYLRFTDSALIVYITLHLVQLHVTWNCWAFTIVVFSEEETIVSIQELNQYRIHIIITFYFAVEIEL